MKYFVFRNMTVERLFQLPGVETTFSGYEDISVIDSAATVYVWCYLPPYKADSRQAAAEIEAYGGMLEMTLQRIGESKDIWGFALCNLFSVSVLSRDPVSVAIENYNRQLNRLAAADHRVKVLELGDFLNRYPREMWIDWKYYFISQMPVNPRLAGDFQAWFRRQAEAIGLRRKKCLVLDLDNTLWGGVLGEDGIAGVRIGGDYPGNAYLLFQQSILELAQSGVILTICSKNNIEDVRAMWEAHPSNLIRENHLAAMRINWQDKATNIQELAVELNIGLDSIVFIDDNPTERELVRGTLPEVTVPDFPAHPYLLPAFIQDVAEKYFTVYSLTEEDRNKTEQYRIKAQREQEKALFQDFDDYLKNLQIQLSIAEVTPLTLERAAQMTQKTNQFNLTTRRYTVADLESFLSSGAKIFTLNVRDKFGDNGITGLMIVTFDTLQHATIDTLLMSCRVLGKGIETAFVNHILSGLFARGIREITATYIPTAKNSQVADFYARTGFQQITEGHYILREENFKPTPTTLYQINS
ncbi:HAD family hydrolase [uncultured Rikenella sp.]|uniref:HAD-IIIC family phosphatase n=1 Tax=uncultured Rikenella sp. TaxID=368003 RepID=UPI00261DBEC1|nr:HAD-IIIC family phosphatase [uncultured Rikenella sp.]